MTWSAHGFRREIRNPHDDCGAIYSAPSSELIALLRRGYEVGDVESHSGALVLISKGTIPSIKKIVRPHRFEDANPPTSNQLS
ncbi:hypothetical protein EW145_g4957 [Phellinidium pouzarii]|uniref:Uncharacterized protein n=1 Tax=Phellinidium pouzarii TaxID=167371 RepID=A0A4V3XCB3_9AGAM|nr:hypothetical protein EW145_g4957 [Phellinidium pouzarii]